MLNTVNDSWKYLLIGTGISLGFGLGLSSFTISNIWNYLRKSLIKNKIKKMNAILLVHKYKGIPYYIDQLGHINITTQLDFLKSYEEMDKDKDIHIIIQTIGGKMICSEAICNCILNHKGKGKIKCYIPYYTYSGGLMIALSCDQIIISKNAIISPCDGQIVTKNNKSYSSSSIMEAVAYKKNKDEQIKEEWLAVDLEAKKCMERHKIFLNKLCKIKSYDEELKQILYDEFFSGKYNHDYAITAENIGNINKLNVSIVDKFPDFIKELLESSLED